MLDPLPPHIWPALKLPSLFSVSLSYPVALLVLSVGARFEAVA
jgi:hypothetical protein